MKHEDIIGYGYLAKDKDNQDNNKELLTLLLDLTDRVRKGERLNILANYYINKETLTVTMVGNLDILTSLKAYREDIKMIIEALKVSDKCLEDYIKQKEK